MGKKMHDKQKQTGTAKNIWVNVFFKGVTFNTFAMRRKGQWTWYSYVVYSVSGERQFHH